MPRYGPKSNREQAEAEAQVEAERSAREAIERGKTRIDSLNQRREVLGWEPLPVHEDGFDFAGQFVSFEDEAGLQKAETEVAREERRQGELRNRAVTPDDLSRLARHFNS